MLSSSRSGITSSGSSKESETTEKEPTQLAIVGREHNHGEAGSFGGTSNAKTVIFEVKINSNKELLEDFEMWVGLII